jgi:hypothetical protein
MDLSPLLKALPIVVVIALTPRLMRLLGRLFPPRASTVGPGHPLDRHNGWINGVAGVLCVGAFGLPLLLFGRDLNGLGWPALGLGFGAAVAVPFAWVALATLPFGTMRFHSFWREYEQKYRIGLPGLATTFGLMILFGAVSVFELFRRGVW